MATDVIVVGAGVMGLSAGIRLAESGARVRVLSAERPRDTTSAVAGAMWGPDFTEPGAGWTRTTLAELTRLAADPATGVRLCRGTQTSDFTDQPPPWWDTLPEVRLCEPAELRPGMRTALRSTIPLVEMPRYLDHLTARLADLGTEVEIRRVGSLTEPAAEAGVVVNCTGVGARDLVGDDGVRAWWGQHVVVENPGVTEFYYEARAGSEWASYFPHGDHVVLGGIIRRDVWDRDPDALAGEGILARCAEVEPRLADAGVIEHRVGLRPWRAAPRLESERLGDALVVHNYGSGGMGVCHSWGAAAAVRDLLG
ncbi:FAD-dependent oxidoreductase [Actinokineospora auranticolor]|uniref:D-amino-acid oxidase n=1 Tax=Actinokineospora auranticolor TaxID=155976 RepID=A0A2S6GNG9_9PSEU|nr:FAD-dependent oxidoreductase [Actinokineospora auranticolor]PPK66774.1 D-amino-acid oxidase [Actinokineospora auranticolor]